MEIIKRGKKYSVNKLFNECIKKNFMECANILFDAFPMMIDIPEEYKGSEFDRMRFKQSQQDEYFDIINNETYVII